MNTEPTQPPWWAVRIHAARNRGGDHCPRSMAQVCRELGLLQPLTMSETARAVARIWASPGRSYRIWATDAELLAWRRRYLQNRSGPYPRRTQAT
jgi:hypothetical protein